METDGLKWKIQARLLEACLEVDALVEKVRSELPEGIDLVVLPGKATWPEKAVLLSGQCLGLGIVVDMAKVPESVIEALK